MLVHTKSQKIVLNLSDPMRVLTVIPTAKQFTYKGRELLAVPHRMDETRLLRNLGIKAPSPIKHYYRWSGQHTPFNAQRETAEFLTLNPRAFCLSEMGTGKTKSVLWAYDYLRAEGIVRKLLVIAPLSALERTWADEIFQHFPHLSCSVLYGSKEKRLRMLAGDADIYICNHDGIKVIEPELIAKTAIDAIAVDESASFRNASTGRWKSLRKLTTGRKVVWALTGTPTPNDPTDAWAQCRLISPENVSPYFGKWRDTVMRQLTQFKWVPRENAVDMVFEAMQPAIRFERKDCVDLPPCIYQERHVELSPEQKKGYADMLAKLAMEYEGDQVLAVNEAVKMAKLVQIACLGPETEILTDSGWRRIVDVATHQRIWDGIAWVNHDGVIARGQKKVVDFAGVSMTLDHLVLTRCGWQSAEQLLARQDAGLESNRADVWLPDGYQEHHDSQAYRTRLDDAQSSCATYDLLNCGPRNRFVVRGCTGELLIVHNCGVVYGADGNVYLPSMDRINVVREIIEQAGTKVIVFCPFKGVVEFVAEKLREDYSVEVITGDTPKKARDQIFGDFQQSINPRVIVASPAAMSHSLTLTAANTVVWFAPITSNEIFGQANARVTRPGQKHTQFIVMVEGTEVERKMYARLKSKQKMQGLLLTAVRER